MPEKSPAFKAPSKKHQPKGLTIIYEDRDIIVVNKIHGLLTVSTEREKDKTAHFILNEYVKKGNSKSKNRIYIVHRLDRDTSGILIFAKNENAKNHLQEGWEKFNKTYFALVHGSLEEKEGTITSYLTENKAFQMYSVKDPNKGKLSTTNYEVIKENSKYSLLKINLITGRKHQIRVHLSEKEHPVVGDKVYGLKDKGIRRLVLHAASLTITHPFSKKEMTFETEIPTYFRSLIKF